MKSYTVNHQARTITLSAAFTKRYNNLNEDALAAMNKLNELCPNYTIRYAAPRNSKSNRTSYALMEKVFTLVERDDLLAELAMRRGSSEFGKVGEASFNCSFFENRKWFGMVCRKNGITPGMVKTISEQMKKSSWRDAAEEKQQPIELQQSVAAFQQDTEDIA
ncbi:hypothetical protein LJC60_04395 [Ruminococcaceae bacterium OttesenSCG-928-D13]|nr:hypothetical protein [Ruminococcaceae bacterium OttesenSCG-928-D13]